MPTEPVEDFFDIPEDLEEDEPAGPQPEPEVIVKTDREKAIEDIQKQLDALKDTP
jgi:hypothetical protein